MKILICGDSTAQTYDPDQTLMTGWGQLLPDELPGVPVFNHAMAGRSTRTFLAEGRLQRLDGILQADDLLLIQFAHNDEDPRPERHTEPWTTYTANLTEFIRFARDRQARPVLLTPICMRVWENGTLQETHGEYRAAIHMLARKTAVPLLDIYRDSFQVVAAAGEEGSKAFLMHLAPGEDPRYPEGLADNTHTRWDGAARFAACVARELREKGLVPRTREDRDLN